MEIDLTNEMAQLDVVGGMYRKHEKWGKAEEVYKTLLVLQKKSRGVCCHEVACTQYRLGEICRAQGAYDRAIRYYNNAVEIWVQLEKLGLAPSESKLYLLDALSAVHELSTSQLAKVPDAETESDVVSAVQPDVVGAA